MTTTEELAGRLFEAGVGAIELSNIYVGQRLGLRHARTATRPAGTVIVMEERAAESFQAPGHDVRPRRPGRLPQDRRAADRAPVLALLPADPVSERTVGESP